MQMMCTIQNFRIRAVEDDTLHACLLFIYFVFMICGGYVKMAKKHFRIYFDEYRIDVNMLIFKIFKVLLCFNC